MSNPMLPVEVLEMHAQQQRARLHQDLAGLRSTVRTTVREALDTKKIARQNLPAICGAAAVIGLILGYGLAGMFVKD